MRLMFLDYKETGEPGRGEKICTIKFQICIKDIYVRNADRARKYFVVAAMRDDGDDKRSIVDPLLDDSGSNVHDKAGDAGTPRGRGRASSGQGVSECRV